MLTLEALSEREGVGRSREPGFEWFEWCECEDSGVWLDEGFG